MANTKIAILLKSSNFDLNNILKGMEVTAMIPSQIL